MKKLDTGELMLECSGRVLDGYRNIIGISLTNNHRLNQVYSGFDQVIPHWEEPFTQEEREELADAMIARWQEWKASK